MDLKKGDQVLTIYGKRAQILSVSKGTACIQYLDAPSVPPQQFNVSNLKRDES